MEEKVINELGDEIDGKNISTLATIFANSSFVSLEFWKFLNLKFISLEKELLIRDISQISQAFSKRQLMDAEKFTSLINRNLLRPSIKKTIVL